MKKLFKHANLDDIDFQLYQMSPIIDKVDEYGFFLSEIPEELFEQNK
jgi:hypothetical protein